MECTLVQTARGATQMCYDNADDDVDQMLPFSVRSHEALTTGIPNHRQTLNNARQIVVQHTL